MNLFERTKQFAEIQLFKGLVKVLPRLSEEKLLGLARPYMEKIPFEGGKDAMKRLLCLAKRFCNEASKNCLMKMIENFMINVCIKGSSRRNEVENEYGISVPSLFVISPSMGCNLNCYGCYAGEYNKSKEDRLSNETFSRICREAKEVGIYFVTVTGGEPFFYPGLLDLFAEHNDMYFQIYTNGTLIDKKVAARLAEVGNAFPCISVEGFEKETDARRGKGVFRKTIEAMHNLREAGAFYGYSATVTRENNELLVSDEFVDFYIEQGCFLGWYFNYVPIGRKPNLELMPTPEQRDYRRARLDEIRRDKPIFLADFWNDGPLVGGCIAGGRDYFHINNKGDVEPCVFCHFTVDNIHDKSFLEVLQSDFFKAIQKRQPYTTNHLRPCMLIDNPQILRDVVREVGARPSHPGADSLINELADDMDRYSAAYGAIADRVWDEEFAAYPQDLFIYDFEKHAEELREKKRKKRRSRQKRTA
ncbi:MAG: radical SAM protein [Planctomycetota bacterium]